MSIQFRYVDDSSVIMSESCLGFGGSDWLFTDGPQVADGQRRRKQAFGGGGKSLIVERLSLIVDR